MADGNIGIGGMQNLVQAIQASSQSTNNLLLKMIATLQNQSPVLPLTGYVEGTWTPGLAFGGVATGITYGARTGTYTQIGRMVLCQFHLVLTSKGTATGAATLTGLPAVPNAAASIAGSGGTVPHYAAMSGLVGVPQLYGTAGSPVMNFSQFGAAASANLADTVFSDTSALDGSFAFFV